MSFVMLESGTYYHHETIHGARLRDRMPRSVYVPDLTEADIAGCSAVLVADRINPVAMQRKRRILMDYLFGGGTLVVLGENHAQDWVPGMNWEFRPTNFWWWLEQGADPGHRIREPDHPIFRHVAPRDVVWHYHGLMHPPEGARSLVDITPVADPEGKGGSILYDHTGLGNGGRLVVSCLDPVYHHGSFFMPAASRFLTGLLDWMHAEFGNP